MCFVDCHEFVLMRFVALRYCRLTVRVLHLRLLRVRPAQFIQLGFDNKNSSPVDDTLWTTISWTQIALLPGRTMGPGSADRENGCHTLLAKELHVKIGFWRLRFFLPYRYLSLSSNNIDKISSLSGMEKLKVLSLGRNLIKKIENLDGVVDTLEELWMSYNQLEKLVRHFCENICDHWSFWL